MIPRKDHVFFHKGILQDIICSNKEDPTPTPQKQILLFLITALFPHLSIGASFIIDLNNMLCVRNLLYNLILSILPNL